MRSLRRSRGPRCPTPDIGKNQARVRTSSIRCCRSSSVLAAGTSSSITRCPLIENRGGNDGTRNLALAAGCTDPGDYSVVADLRPLTDTINFSVANQAAQTAMPDFSYPSRRARPSSQVYGCASIWLGKHKVICICMKIALSPRESIRGEQGSCQAAIGGGLPFGAAPIR
jgi:hypothetical protein